MLFSFRRKRLYDAAEHSRKVLRWICDDAIRAAKNVPETRLHSYDSCPTNHPRNNNRGPSRSDQLELVSKRYDIGLEALKSAIDDNDPERLLAAILHMEQRLIEVQARTCSRGHLNIIAPPDVQYMNVWTDGVSTMMYPLKIDELKRAIDFKKRWNTLTADEQATAYPFPTSRQQFPRLDIGRERDYCPHY